MRQTPALSRRFLPPSSSTQKASPNASAKTPLPAFPQLPPSSSAAPPFSHASRFRTPAKAQNEDINTSFEDGHHNSSDPRVQRFTPFAVSGADAIDEDGVDLVFEDVHTLQNDIDTPIPKRRKLTVSSPTSEEPMLLPSSPAPAAVESDSEAMTDQYSDLDEDPSSIRHDRTPRMTTRFKMRRAAAPLVDSVEQKPIFRPPEPLPHLAAEITTVLPEAFTPSRKKGKTDYIPGGLADTIRNTILGIATEAAQKGGLDEKVVLVDAAEIDSSRCAILVTDHENVRWILPGHCNGKRSEGLAQKLERVQAAGQVVISGSATHWTLPLDWADANDEVRFAAHWNVVGER